MTFLHFLGCWPPWQSKGNFYYSNWKECNIIFDKVMADFIVRFTWSTLAESTINTKQNEKTYIYKRPPSFMILDFYDIRNRKRSPGSRLIKNWILVTIRSFRNYFEERNCLWKKLFRFSFTAKFFAFCGNKTFSVVLVPTVFMNL